MQIQGSSILIKPDVPDKTPSGVILPPSKRKSPTGTVIDVGPECEIVRKGDRVHYNNKAATVITIDDVQHHFIVESQIAFVHG